MSTLPQYEESRFRDSGKVLRAIVEIIDQHVAAVTQLTGTNNDDAAFGEIAKNTCGLIKETLDDSAKVTKIWTPRTETGSMDPRD